jgi:hypothetical protein
MPAKSSDTKIRKISGRGMKYLEERGLDPVWAVQRFGLFTAQDHDGAGSTDSDSANYLGIPYTRGHEETYLQFRDMRPGLPHRDRYRSPKGSVPAIFNVDAIDDPGLDGKALTICEGAFDPMAAMQAGAQRVIGIPGAEQTDLISKAEEEFDEVKQIILAGHDDDAGKLMNTKLAEILSPSRCKTIQWATPGCDLNDVLLKLGKDALLDHLRGAKFCQVPGVYKPKDVPRRPMRPVMKVSAFGADFYHHIGIRKRDLSIWTGVANDGKTTLLKGLLWAMMQEHGTHPAAAFYEDDYYEDIIPEMGALYLGRPYQPPDEERVQDWLQNYWAHIEAPEDDEAYTIRDFIEQAKATVAQSGADFVLADPWSTFSVAHKQFSETEMIRRGLIALRNFGRDFNCHVAIVAHPRKHNEYGGTTKMADGNDVAGSLHFSGRCDLGVTVARDDVAENVTKVSVWKVRKKAMGKRGLFHLEFDEATGRYSPMTREDVAKARGEDPADVIDIGKARRRRGSSGGIKQRKDIYG